MGYIQSFAFCLRNKHLIISLALLLITSFTHRTFMAQGRPMPNAAEVFKGREEKLKERALIGSRPPRCARRCSSCVHCEAIQVPIVPQQRHLKPTRSCHLLPSRTRKTLNSRGDDLSNYKPMSWKCKCGNLIFDP